MQPKGLDRASAELAKAETSVTHLAVWHVVKAVRILVEYLRARER